MSADTKDKKLIHCHPTHAQLTLYAPTVLWILVLHSRYFSIQERQMAKSMDLDPDRSLETFSTVHYLFNFAQIT
jgi:hypothetical protein